MESQDIALTLFTWYFTGLTISNCNFFFRCLQLPETKKITINVWYNINMSYALVQAYPNQITICFLTAFKWSCNSFQHLYRLILTRSLVLPQDQARWWSHLKTLLLSTSEMWKYLILAKVPSKTMGDCHTCKGSNICTIWISVSTPWLLVAVTVTNYL